MAMNVEWVRMAPKASAFFQNMRTEWGWRVKSPPVARTPSAVRCPVSKSFRTLCTL